MYPLDSAQINQLAQLLVEEYGTSLSTDQIFDLVGDLLENIAGCEWGSDGGHHLIIERIRSRYMSSAKKTETTPATPKNPAQIKKAVALGKEMAKQPETTKAAIAQKMYDLIHEEPREVIVEAFMEGAGLTPKGAMTYYYNAKRKVTKKGA